MFTYADKNPPARAAAVSQGTVLLEWKCCEIPMFRTAAVANPITNIVQYLVFIAFSYFRSCLNRSFVEPGISPPKRGGPIPGD